jgi:hypothetical protein
MHVMARWYVVRWLSGLVHVRLGVMRDEDHGWQHGSKLDHPRLRAVGAGEPPCMKRILDQWRSTPVASHAASIG